MRQIFFIIILILLIAFFCAVWGFFIEPNRLIINRYELNSRNWSTRLNQFKIIALSDIHAGSNFIDEKKLRQIVVEVNSQEPDVIVLLGDFVAFDDLSHQNLKMPLQNVFENLRGFQAKHGVFAVLGNTDEEFGSKEISDALEEIGIKVLNNESVHIKINGERICFLGMQNKMISGDWNKISNELKEVLAKENPEDKVIVLVHNPDYLPVITGDLSISNNLSLVLAGHTHGGQVRIPLIGAPIVPSEYGQKYAGGFIRDFETDMFITTGIGTSKIPVRFGVPPEIAVLTLYTE